MIDDKWRTRETPILEAIAEIEAKGDPHADFDEIVEATGLGEADVSQGLRALYDADYLTGTNPGVRANGWFRLDQVRFLERGRRAVGQWPPADAYDALLVEIDARLETATERERSLLDQFRQSVIAVGESVAGALLVDVARKLASGL